MPPPTSPAMAIAVTSQGAALRKHKRVFRLRGIATPQVRHTGISSGALYCVRFVGAAFRVDGSPAGGGGVRGRTRFTDRGESSAGSRQPSPAIMGTATAKRGVSVEHLRSPSEMAPHFKLDHYPSRR